MAEDDIKVRLAIIEEKTSTMDKRIDKMEGNQRWVVLAVVGAIIGTILQKLGLN